VTRTGRSTASHETNRSQVLLYADLDLAETRFSLSAQVSRYVALGVAITWRIPVPQIPN